MDTDFWHRRWESNDIGFHQNSANPLLVKHMTSLELDQGSRIFLPLCGKTLDIAWLVDKGYVVAGVELSELAIQQLFEALGITPQVSSIENFIHYSSPGIDLFVGDFFQLTHDTIGAVDAIYDRAALVALPLAMRLRYTDHLINVSKQAPQLLINFEYDQNAMDGPPFSISDDEIQQHYLKHYKLALLESGKVENGLKQQCEAIEKIWLLKTR